MVGGLIASSLPSDSNYSLSIFLTKLRFPVTTAPVPAKDHPTWHESRASYCATWKS